MVKEPGKLELVFTPDGGGEVQKWEVHQFDGPGVGMGMYNIEESIKGFAKASFEYALDKKWYATCYMALCDKWYNLGCTLQNCSQTLQHVQHHVVDANSLVRQQQMHYTN